MLIFLGLEVEMRPDKHKKKHHAAYAKRTAQKNNRNGKTSTETTDTSSQSHHNKDRDNKIKTDANTSEPNESMRFTSSVSDRDELSSAFNRDSSEDNDNFTSFTRRQIESNWQQYHELPEEEQIVDQRGADFTLLLTQTAGSQFRFKDEETLDEDTTELEVPSSLLSFDCNELAQKLQTISLPERLEISRTIFDQEMLEILDQDAATSKTLTNNQINTTDQQILPSSTKLERNTTFDHELDDILARSQTDETLHQSLQAEQDPSVASNSRLEASPVFQSEGKAEEKEINKEGLVSNNLLKPLSAATNLGTTTIILEEDDDGLDFLLSLRSPVVNESHHDSRLKDETPDISKPQEETSGHLSLGNDGTQEIKPSVLSERSQNSVAVESSDAQTESLDDWLDSILDD